MLISLNEIKKYVKIPSNISEAELIERIGSRLVEIEEVIDLRPKYQGIYIAKVVSAEKIPDTHLSLCQIDAGEITSKFSDGDTVQVVCGAPNVHAGMLAVWITPGAIVPETYGNENFRLSVRKLRGYESNGMLAAIDELDLGDDHEGIAEIDPKTAKPGDVFAEVFELNDTILDVENKSLTHRPDCFGLVGFAREIAGILGQEFKEPEWLTADCNQANLTISTDPDLCPRYSCAIFEMPDNTPSKYFTKDAAFLAKSGMRAIDPMVDLTNIMMLETGQPLHAFDYDKFVAVGQTDTPKIIVRAAKKDEELQLLDGKTIKCDPADILITSNDVPVALAGAMGGKNTEIDASTKRVILESATFSLFHLRKTQMLHGIFSEAITRFTKGQPAAMTMPVLTETVHRLGASAEIADEYPSPTKPATIKLTVDEVNTLLGTDYKESLIKSTLENVGFSVKAATSGALEVTAPVWRTDIHIKEDVIEEVGRLLGFDNIALDLPLKSFSGTAVSEMWQFKQDIRGILSHDLGMNELLTYSFISKSLLKKVGQNLEESYEITNSISPELECFRQHLVPSLLDKVRENLRSGHSDFSLYELNQVSSKSLGLTPEETPSLEMHLGLLTLGDFYRIKYQALTLLNKRLHLNLSYRQLAGKSLETYPYLEPKRSAEIVLGSKVIGAFGEVKKSVLREFKLDQTISVAEITIDELATLPRQPKINLKVSKFPFVERDLTLKVNSDAEFGRFYNIIEETLESQNLIAETSPLSIYQEQDSKTKNISFHLKFSSPDKTLDQDEISDIMNLVTVEAVKLGATAV